MSRTHIVAISACLLAAAAPAAAQFTTVIQPPASAVKQQQQAVARIDSARKRTDSATVASRLTNMKSWVDSAAGVTESRKPVPPPDSAATVRPGARADSAAPPLTAVSTRAVPAPAETHTTFRDGAPAPATGTELPLLALLASGAVVAGAVLRRR
ncbi:MAG: hypothetical protein M3068_08355 [Gemmatimonadota bacterium]|nr:hypothetical protein [Gemmatimonadota bacterium]